ncbi:MAG TPA: hypothetical protein PLU72_07000 [Candidatus Ozemobacteraceae bacterium]|nr:hypothetical protein [Candidatus Ozemobacteraceae bacterium]
MIPKTQFRRLTCLVLLLLCLGAARAQAARDPILLVDQPGNTMPVGAFGPTFKFKRTSGPEGFGGEMVVWGARGFGGRLDDPKLGLMAQAGTLTGTGLTLNLRMGGFTVEDHFMKDTRLKWRVGLGGGTFELKSRISSRVVNEGSFAFAEPMLVGVIPMTRHIVLEIGAGYTFCGVEGVRLEGLFVQTDLLLGRF